MPDRKRKHASSSAGGAQPEPARRQRWAGEVLDHYAKAAERLGPGVPASLEAQLAAFVRDWNDPNLSSADLGRRWDLKLLERDDYRRYQLRQFDALQHFRVWITTTDPPPIIWFLHVARRATSMTEHTDTAAARAKSVRTKRRSRG